MSRKKLGKKIVIAAGIFPPDIGGPATYVEQIAGALSNRSVEVVVICFSKFSSYGKYEFKVIRVPRKYNIVFRYLIYFYNLVIKSKDADVIFAQGPISAGVPALLAAKLLNKKFVLKITGDAAWERACERGIAKDTLEVFQIKKYDFRSEMLRKIQRFVAGYAIKVIVPSLYLKNIVEGWGIDKNRICVIYNALTNNSKWQYVTKEGAKEQINFEGDMILSIGRLVPWKGFGALIEIMPEILQVNPRFRLVIVGEGPLLENYKLQITNYKLGGVVSLLGAVEHEKLPLYFRAADMFVLNSGYEGFSHVILEAMTAGVPVIATNVGGNPELIEDDASGFLVSANDSKELKEKILEVWQNKALRQKLVKNSEEKLKNFSFKGMVKGTMCLLIGYDNL